MENNTYVLILRNETDKKNIAGALPKSSSSGEDSFSGGVNSKKKRTRAQEITGKVALGVRKIRSTANTFIAPELARVELRTGSREQQQKANFTYNMISKGFGLAESVAMGYAVGNLAGAVVGAVLSLASTGISLAQKQITIDTQRSLEDITRNLSAQRATVSGGRYMNATEF